MRKSSPIVMYILAGLLLIASGSHTHISFRSSHIQSIQTPVLKWQHGGCYSTWCETGWYSSPAVADLDNDGTMEVIGAAYTVFALNGENGSEQWSVDPEGGRVWPGIVVADLEGDGDLEVVTGHGDGYLHVLDHAGNSVWPRNPTSNELRGLAVYDLDGDGTLEVIANGATYDKVNTWIYEHDGTLRTGWPQLSDTSGYAHGVFNDNASVGDIDGDGIGEIVVPSDVHYICAYEPNGDQVPAHTMYGTKDWGAVGVWESLATELKGWGSCSGSRAERYRTNFASGASVIADVNGDGIVEVVVTGNVYDCAVGHPPGKYNGVYIFNADRSRLFIGGFDWQIVPVDTGAPLSEDWNVIENNVPNPAVADLDGDGYKEILYSSYDGRVHVFWLDKTEHGNWPYSVYNSSEGIYRFASEPTVADLDNDGYAEVIFASWVQKGSYKTGKLHILDYLGNPLQEVNLPLAYGSVDWNGALAAPTLANIDDDSDLEVVLNTAHSGLVAYDLPNTGQARVLWGTGRGNYHRNGSVISMQDDILGTWDSTGVWYRNSATDKWIKMTDAANLVAAGELDGDGIADLIGVWNSGLWVKYSSTGIWAKLAISLPSSISSGDMNGDGRDDILATWAGSGVWYRNSITSHWIKISSPANIVTAGNIDGDNSDDLIGTWSSGLWVKYASTGSWIKLSSSVPTDIASGDMNGDGRDDVLGIWSSGIWYRDSMTGSWIRMSTPANLIASGDIDGDNTDDLIGVWSSGLWVKCSSTGSWTNFSTALPRDIDAGFFRAVSWGTSSVRFLNH